MIWNHELDQTSSDSDFFDGVQWNALWQMACQDLMNFFLSFVGLLEALHHVLQDPTDGGPEWTLTPVTYGGSGLQPVMGAFCRHCLQLYDARRRVGYCSRCD